MIQDAATLALLVFGALFMLLASIGIYRMPDVFLRMSASSKATTLGLILIMLAVAIHFNSVGVTARAIGIVLFIILTGPVSAHMIGRAAYITGTPLWEGTCIDELAGRYDAEHRCSGRAPAEAPDGNSGP
ncbi:MAG: monovalent cation/H(+) antiporter subunit G [Chloroflexota bacterium]|jgi:multicomponent Na+:H+ antiporter subunit G|nr:monovalent cation/H(+) antiporter subunit G [Anaerolineae bacterium]